MKNIIGFMMINAPHSALNNAGMDEGAKTENCVIVKKIRKGRESYAYVSPQAFRYWLRDTLSQEKNWEMSPVTRGKKIAFTSVDPINYPDDDMFGYMRAQSDKDGGTVTRISPFKCSPLISILPDRIADDYGVMARQEGDPVPYEHEFYSTVFKGIFSIDIESAGKFSVINKTGFRNISEKYIDDHKDDNNIIKTAEGIKLSKDITVKRIKDVLEVIPYLYGGAKNTTHLTDVSPRVIILAVIKGGNNIFMDIAENKDGKAWINMKAFKEIVLDYDKEILSDIFIGIREGFNNDLKAEITALSNEYKGNHKILVLTPNKAVEEFVKLIPEHIE